MLLVTRLLAFGRVGRLALPPRRQGGGGCVRITAIRMAFRRVRHPWDRWTTWFIQYGIGDTSQLDQIGRGIISVPQGCRYRHRTQRRLFHPFHPVVSPTASLCNDQPFIQRISHCPVRWTGLRRDSTPSLTWYCTVPWLPSKISASLECIVVRCTCIKVLRMSLYSAWSGGGIQVKNILCQWRSR